MIHPTAIVHPGAKLAPDVQVDAYTMIGEHVEIGPGTSVGPHAVITGHTRIGAGNRIFQFVSLGEIPQDKKYGGEPTRLEIGDYNTIREFCTLNTGTAQDVGVTRVGDHNWIMAYVHLAHDCQVGSHTVLANLVALAGHVTVDDYVIFGGGVMVHQFSRIGVHAFVAGGSLVHRDVPPYVMAGGGSSAEPHGINTEGLRRRGFSATAIESIRRAYKALYRAGLTLEQAKEAIAEQARETPELQVMVDFLAASTRGIIR
jgi:UDP-N-acetylglucosamine acyltransferase